MREIVGQQFTFSPPGPTVQREEYATSLDGVLRSKVDGLRDVCWHASAEVTIRIVSGLCQVPAETPAKHRHLQGHSDAHRCCGKSLMESALESTTYGYAMTVKMQIV
jgi:hypothetical protein